MLILLLLLLLLLPVLGSGHGTADGLFVAPVPLSAVAHFT